MTGEIILNRGDLDFTDSVRKYGSKLLGFIKSRVNIVEDAEDILQDVWYRYFTIGVFEEIESISGWLFRVAKNRIFDYYRKRKPVLSGDLYAEDENNLYLFDNLAEDDAQNPEEEFSRNDFLGRLKKALEELPPEQSSVFIRNEIDGMTLREIAESDGENIKTVTSRKGYAVKRLKEKLGAFNNGI